jgi:Rha family phage regulatory protein
MSMNRNLPALCAELRIRIEGNIALVNSRNVAELFEKEHRNVLRDIDEARKKISSDLSTSWFRPVISRDSYGREQPSFDLTRQGFTLLVMGWTGELAMQFKVRYIEVFDAMEAQLNVVDSPVSGTELIQAVREIVAPLAVRFDGHDQAIERVETRVDAIAEDVGSIKLRLFNSRRRISEATKRSHIEDNRLLGGRCQHCGENEVICGGMKSPFAEFDHFYQSSQPNADHTWLVCKLCHTGLTTGRIPRDKAASHFLAYQEKRRHLPGRQRRLF